MSNWFGRSLQSGGALSSVIQIVTYLWPALTVAVLGAFTTALWSGALAWIERPSVFVPALVFGYLFVIFAALKSRAIKILPDYEYAITMDGSWTAVLARFPQNHPTDPSADGVVLVVPFRNVCTSPIRIVIEEFRVVLDNRTFAEQPPVPEIVMPRLSPKGIKSAMVVRDVTKTNLVGSVQIKFLYGPVRGKVSRRYSLKCNLEVAIASMGPFGHQVALMTDIIEELDNRYLI